VLEGYKGRMGFVELFKWPITSINKELKRTI
jgi:hypothetical protein